MNKWHDRAFYAIMAYAFAVAIIAAGLLAYMAWEKVS